MNASRRIACGLKPREEEVSIRGWFREESDFGVSRDCVIESYIQW